MLEPFLTAEGIVSFLTLSIMEVVLGIDNIIFISILSDRLPAEDQKKGRLIGLSLALIIRIFLLMIISIIVGFTKPVIEDFYGIDISLRDIILFSGGLFLIYKSTAEIHEKLEGEEEDPAKTKKLSLVSAVIQIVLLDIVFSFDSILTAIGLVNNPHRDLPIMIAAIIVSIIVMLLFAKSISHFINTHPTIKMLALTFLLLIGILLVAEAFHYHVPKGYIYFAIGFSLGVEMLNMRAKRKSKPVKLRNNPDLEEEEEKLHKEH
ncbi:TerC family protein [Sporocytophaga myxococcoides]|uniref:TerC family protein n=1 Tax=Sporocytophaga myxococcoides TaxID=153721 RepID=UPI00040636D8|nr:TerC family protein [Sporocytophaga myxococcoides]